MGYPRSEERRSDPRPRWPLLIHEYPNREGNPDIDLLDAGAIRKPLVLRQFSDLFANDSIRAYDLAEV